MLNRQRKSVNGASILVLGVAYKRDTTDVRESPALDVMQLLVNQGAQLRYHDPHVRELQLADKRMKGLVRLGPAQLKAADVVIVVTDHSDFDYDNVVRHARVVLDTRNAMAAIKRGRRKIHKL